MPRRALGCISPQRRHARPGRGAPTCPPGECIDETVSGSGQGVGSQEASQEARERGSGQGVGSQEASCGGDEAAVVRGEVRVQPGCGMSRALGCQDQTAEPAGSDPAAQMRGARCRRAASLVAMDGGEDADRMRGGEESTAVLSSPPWPTHMGMDQGAGEESTGTAEKGAACMVRCTASGARAAEGATKDRCGGSPQGASLEPLPPPLLPEAASATRALLDLGLPPNRRAAGGSQQGCCRHGGDAAVRAAGCPSAVDEGTLERSRARLDGDENKTPSAGRDGGDSMAADRSCPQAWCGAQHREGQKSTGIQGGGQERPRTRDTGSVGARVPGKAREELVARARQAASAAGGRGPAPVFLCHTTVAQGALAARKPNGPAWAAEEQLSHARQGDVPEPGALDASAAAAPGCLADSWSGGTSESASEAVAPGAAAAADGSVSAVRPLRSSSALAAQGAATRVASARDAAATSGGGDDDMLADGLSVIHS